MKFVERSQSTLEIVKQCENVNGFVVKEFIEGKASSSCSLEILALIYFSFNRILQVAGEFLLMPGDVN